MDTMVARGVHRLVPRSIQRSGTVEHDGASCSRTGTSEEPVLRGRIEGLQRGDAIPEFIIDSAVAWFPNYGSEINQGK